MQNNSTDLFGPVGIEQLAEADALWTTVSEELRRLRANGRPTREELARAVVDLECAVTCYRAALENLR